MLSDRFVRAAILLLLFAAHQVAMARTRVTGVRYWSGPEHTRIVLDLSHEVQFKSNLLKDGPRVYVDLFDATLSGPLIQQVDVEDGLILRLRLAQNSEDTVRLVVDLAHEAPFNASLLAASGDKPPRLFLDIMGTEQVSIEPPPVSVEVKKDEKARIVVIDPGHGGEDPGATWYGLREKEVTLDVATRIKCLLNGQSNIQCIATRDADYDVSLKRRLSILKKSKGEIFVSLHINASKSKVKSKTLSRSARGLEVYLYSLSGPTDDAAKLLASRENSADFFGGDESPFGSDADQKMENLANSGAFSDNERLAVELMAELTRVEPFNQCNRGIKRAGFYVLRTGAVPSVLLEFGFISHPLDAKLLAVEQYREMLAVSICNGINRYFDPVDDFTPVYRRPEIIVYQIKKGDTLTEVASRFSVPASAIMDVSGVDDMDSLAVGDTILIPVALDKGASPTPLPTPQVTPTQEMETLHPTACPTPLDPETPPLREGTSNTEYWDTERKTRRPWTSSR